MLNPEASSPFAPLARRGPAALIIDKAKIAKNNIENGMKPNDNKELEELQRICFRQSAKK